MLPLQKRADQGGRLFGLIEHEVMTSFSHIGPLHVWTHLVNLLQEG